MTSAKDYAPMGIDIQTAMVRHVRAYPDRRTRPDHIIWNHREVRTFLTIAVPIRGRFRIKFLSAARGISQGVDVSADGGGVVLPNGKSVQTLRTWHDQVYEETVEY